MFYAAFIENESVSHVRHSVTRAPLPDAEAYLKPMSLHPATMVAILIFGGMIVILISAMLR